MSHRAGDVQAEVLRPEALGPSELAAWRAMQARAPAFGSPLLSPEFAQAVGEVRADARVAVFHRGGEIVGFLAHHKRPGGFARPIGAPFCDYHALIGRADAPIVPAQALQAADLAVLRLSGLVDPFDAFDEVFSHRIWAHRIVLDGDAADYLEALWRGSANRRKNHRRYRRALAREAGALRLVGDDRDPAAFRALVAWKREQLHRTGLHDFLAVPWAEALMLSLFETRSGAFSGQMISLYAGERLVAAHFGVRVGGWFHPWIGAFDQSLRTHSPGMVHQVEAIAAMTELGLSTYDLGPGEGHWKRQFTEGGDFIGVGLATAPNVAGALARSADRFWSLPPVLGAPVLGRVRNRLDQIAALELTLGGRVQGAALALGAQRRRKWAA